MRWDVRTYEVPDPDHPGYYTQLPGGYFPGNALCSIVVTKRSNVRGAKGAGHRRWDRVNWKQEELRASG